MATKVEVEVRKLRKAGNLVSRALAEVKRIGQNGAEAEWSDRSASAALVYLQEAETLLAEMEGW